MPRPRILVALSGGVDSSVAALLLQREGHDIVGAYMKNWINEDQVIGHCPWQQDIEDARAVADRLGIEFRVVNLMHDYRRLVVDYLLDGYRRGLTPNPDVMCNREMKFGVFADYARAEGFTAVATGHYARRRESPASASSGMAEIAAPGLRLAVGARLGATAHPGAATHASAGAVPALALLEGSDPNKDQSYFLALLSPEQLAFARFPIGHLRKPDLRRLAADAGLPTAGKKDSQGICFIGEVKMADFLKAYVPEHPGPIIRATDGRILGEHRGLHYYTIGQRRGIRIPSNTDHEAYVVVGKRAADHALLVAFDGPAAPGLWTSECRVHSLSFLGEPLVEPCRLECRVRYRDPRVPIEFVPDNSALPVGRVVPATPPLGSSGVSGAGSTPGRAPLAGARASASDAPPANSFIGAPVQAAGATIRFASPQRALAPGQIMALYRGERLLGGAVFA